MNIKFLINVYKLSNLWVLFLFFIKSNYLKMQKERAIIWKTNNLKEYDNQVLIKPSNDRGVYVLHLRINFKKTEFIYVGYSEDINSRIEQHVKGEGSNITRNCTLIGRLKCMTPFLWHKESWERLEYLTQVKKFGIQRVRGWKFVRDHLCPIDIKEILSNLCEAFNLCRKCFHDDHWSSICPRKRYLGNEL